MFISLFTFILFAQHSKHFGDSLFLLVVFFIILFYFIRSAIQNHYDSKPEHVKNRIAEFIYKDFISNHIDREVLCVNQYKVFGSGIIDLNNNLLYGIYRRSYNDKNFLQKYGSVIKQKIPSRYYDDSFFLFSIISRSQTKIKEYVNFKYGDKSFESVFDLYDEKKRKEILIIREIENLKIKKIKDLKDKKLLELENEMLKGFGCSLEKTALNLVFGSGNSNAKIIIIGEAPGSNEDDTGIPFTGNSGEQLLKHLKYAGIKEDNIYKTNVLKYRPPNNRDPEFSEIERHSRFLLRQIEIINPDVIVTMGNYSTKLVLSQFDVRKMALIPGITKLRGKTKEVLLNTQKFKVLPMFHPAVLLYDKTGAKEVLFNEDFKTLAKLI
jgi:uracil-DNA glycosylase family 4